MTEKMAVCVSKNISMQLSVLEWEMINLSKGLQRGGGQPDPISAQLQIESI